jgi:hypothetical protein
LGWHLLFDGKTTSGWHSTHVPDFPATGWEVKDGLLSVTEHGGEEGGNSGDILTTRKYANLELSVEFRITADANSGIKYFVDPAFTPGHEGHGSDVGFEYQVLDDALHPDAKKGRDGDRTVASLYDMIPAAKSKPIKPVGQWNTARIVIRGSHGEHWLNGVTVVDYDRATPEFRAIVAASKFHIYPTSAKPTTATSSFRTTASRGSSHIQPKTTVKDFDLALIQCETKLDALLLAR